MRISIAISLAFILSGCGKRISPYFTSNSYVSEMHSHVVNDSLRLHHKSFGDVEFAKNRNELKRAIGHRKDLQNVLMYGKTVTAPFYEYFVELPGYTNKIPKSSQEDYRKDTVLGGRTYSFKGFTLDSLDASRDFDQIFNNITVGDGYKTNIGSFDEILKPFIRSNRFLKALREISQFPVSGKSEASFQLQMQLTYASFLGNNTDYRHLLKKWESASANDSIAELIDSNSIKGDNEVLQFILT